MKVASLVVACCLLNVVFGNLTPKQLAGPPSEFADHKLPQPFAGALVEGSALFQADFAQFVKQNALKPEDTTVWAQDLLVDSSEKFLFSFFSLDADKVKLTLVNPNGQEVDLSRFAFKDFFAVGLHSVPGTTFVFEKPIVGVWKLTVSPAQQTNLHEFVQSVVKSRKASQMVDAVVLLWNESPMKIYTRLNTYNLQAGQEVGLITTITEDSQFSETFGARASLNVTSISVAEMDIVTPDGDTIDVDMKDDGLTQDGLANDGTYGALVKVQEVGDYEFQAVVRGVRSDGVEFIRTTQHVVSVTSNDLDLVGTASGAIQSNNRMAIKLAVTTPPNFPRLNPKFRAYAEVWAKDQNGNDVAVCWISSISDLEAPFDTLSLELDLKWLARAEAKAPITLKNVYVQDAYTMIPVSEVSEIPVTVSEQQLTSSVSMLGSVSEITLEMKQGVMPAHIAAQLNSTATGSVVLVHGYCAGSNPWADAQHQWTNAHYFSNPNSNLQNQHFADKVASFASSKGLAKYSLVGHSQGGMVGTHLLNYYFSGMDATAAGRKVQSVGTPYTGCSAAGSAANLGKAFGVGCGENFDLSKDGAKLWLAGITSETKKNVFFYTTTYKQGNLLGDYCNMAINMILQWPNDGTTELDYAQLSGANNMGNKQQWCHTTSMKYPAQYTDAARNVEMNANAAR